MCLLITAISASITTLVWYFFAHDRKYKLGGLALMYWGASFMWLIDCFFALGAGEPFLDVSANDAILGLVVVASGFLLWLAVFLFSDPKKVFSSLSKNKEIK